MKKIPVLLAIFALSACGNSGTSSNIIGKGNLSLSIQPSASVKDGVSGFKVEVFSGQTLVDSTYVVLSTATLPSGLVPDAGNNHNFASALFVLVPGIYHVKISPMKSETVPSTLCATAEADVTINADATTTVTLVSQCVDANNGGLEVVAALNNNPQILDLDYNPSSFVSTCQNLTVTLTAQDPDGDALTYNWQVVGAPSGNGGGLNDNFESYVNGDLNGQGSWTGSTEFQVQGTTFHSGSNAIKGLVTENRRISRSIANTTSSHQIVYIQISNSFPQTSDAGLSLRENITMLYQMGIYNDDPSGLHFFYRNELGRVWIVGTVNIDTWYRFEIEVRSSDKNARYRVGISDGSPGSWTSWDNPIASYSTGINTVELLQTKGYLTESTCYFDDLSSTAGASYFSSSVNNVYSFTGYVPGTYSVQATACDPFSLCSSLTAPIHVFGIPCQP